MPPLCAQRCPTSTRVFETYSGWILSTSACRLRDPYMYTLASGSSLYISRTCHCLCLFSCATVSSEL